MENYWELVWKTPVGGIMVIALGVLVFLAMVGGHNNGFRNGD